MSDKFRSLKLIFPLAESVAPEIGWPVVPTCSIKLAVILSLLEALIIGATLVPVIFTVTACKLDTPVCLSAT